MTDTFLEEKVKKFQSKIISWATKHHVWQQTSFQTYYEHFQDEPSEVTACILVMCLDSALGDMFNGGNDSLMTEFDKMMEATEFWHEMYSSDIVNFYCKEDKLNKQYLDYFEWQWISELIKPDYTNLYQEIFEYFKINPKKLYSLAPRKFEILISEIFKNQGYNTDLGTGWKDGGVDLRLYKKDEIDEIVTLVQIKRYKESLPIKLESVAYLQAIVDDEKANRGLFITTSRYLPQAKKFTERQNKKIILTDSQDVVKWCDIAKTKIIRDKSKAISEENILEMLKMPNGLVGKVVVSNIGVTMTLNEFCLIVKDTPNTSLLMKISSQHVEYFDPPYNCRGSEIPLLNDTIIKFKNKESIFRATKSVDTNGTVSFWGNKTLYFLWDDRPKHFDYID